jgi:invasion protein IalB
MQDDTTESVESRTSRRAVLKRASVATAAGLLAATGAAAASTGRQANAGTLKDCGTEYDCWSTKCSSGYNSEVKRQCCEYDDGTVECEDWEYTGNCCL